MKKYFNLYHLLIIILIAIVITSIIIVFVQRKRSTVDGIEIILSNVKEDEEITEKEARKVAVRQFAVLGENVNEEDLTVKKMTKQEEDYYYIVSRENTLEIKILGGQITRINTILINN